MGLIGAGIGLGAATDLAVGAINGKEEAPVYIMEGQQDAITSNTDESWNLLKFSSESENFVDSATEA